MDLSLKRMEEALAVIGQLECPAVQVLGTNGKGSTCAHISALARCHGLMCGTYLSPHFVSVKERILVNGQQLPDQDWLAGTNYLARHLSLADLTYFELLTLLAVILFRSARVNLAIFEAGLGGWHDATTALQVLCQCYTPIAMDHASIIGPGLEDIARDKARAIRPGVEVFSAPQYPLVTAILSHQAKKLHASLHVVQPLPSFPEGRLSGATQATNFALARSCWHYLARLLGVSSLPAAEQAALQEAYLPGRMEYVPACSDHPAVILDGAHNPHAIQALLRQLPQKPAAIIYSALSDKDWRTCMGLLSRYEVPILVPQLDNPRAARAEEIAACSPLATPFLGSDGLKEALKHTEGLILVCGSFYLLSQFYELFPRHKI